MAAVAAILALVVAMIVIGCGEDEETATTAAPTETSAAPTETTAAPTETTAAPTETSTGGPATNEPIKIGLNQCYTGISAGAFQGQLKAIYAKRDAVNAQGGINGRPVELVELDTKSDPTQAANNMTNLCTQDDIAACFIPYPPEEILATAPIVEKFGMPSMTTTAQQTSNPQLHQGEWLFFVMDSAQAAADAGLVEIQARGWKSALGIADQILLDQEILQALKETGAPQGVDVTILSDLISLADTDLTPYANKIYAEWKKNPTDAVFLMMAFTQFPQLYKGLRGLGLEVPILMGPTCCHASVFSMGDEAVEGAVVLGPAAINPSGLPADYPNRDMMLELDTVLREQHDTTLDAWSARAADSMEIIFEGLRVGGNDRAATRDAMEALKDFPSYQGGVISYAPGDHRGIEGGWVSWELKDGEYTFVRILD